MFAVTRDLQFGNLKVTVKELTVAEVRAWLNEPTPTEETEFDILIGMMEIHRFTTLKKEEVEQLPPSALTQLAAVIKELNSVFFNEYLVKLNEVRQRLELSSTPVPSNAA